MAHQSLKRTWFVTKFAGDFSFGNRSVGILSLDDRHAFVEIGLGTSWRSRSTDFPIDGFFGYGRALNIVIGINYNRN